MMSARFMTSLLVEGRPLVRSHPFLSMHAFPPFLCDVLADTVDGQAPGSITSVPAVGYVFRPITFAQSSAGATEGPAMSMKAGSTLEAAPAELARASLG